MKQKIVVIYAIALLFLAFAAPKTNIVGNWKVTYGNGMKGSTIFNDDGSFEARFPDQHFKVGGHYKIDGNICLISDTSCGVNYWGKYKETFYTPDSFATQVIEDSCTDRRMDASGATMVRIK